MFHLASLPTPRQPPIATHQRRSWLASSRMTRNNVTVQNTKSGVVVVSSCMAPRYSAQVAAASAASSWPVRPAPSRRLIAAVITTSAARASAGRIRKPTSELPVTAAEIRASTGVRAIPSRGGRAGGDAAAPAPGTAEGAADAGTAEGAADAGTAEGAADAGTAEGAGDAG